MLFSSDFELRRGQIPPQEMMRRLSDSMTAVTRMNGPGVIQMPGGLIFPPADVDNLWIVILGNNADGSGSASGLTNSAWHGNYYDWQAAVITTNTDGTENIAQDPNGQSGKHDAVPAIEVNGNTLVQVGTIVRAWRSPSWRAYYFCFGDQNLGSGNSGGSAAGHSVVTDVNCDGNNLTVTKGVLLGATVIS